MSEPLNKTQGLNEDNVRRKHRRKRSGRHLHAKTSRYKRFTNWVKNNVVKFIAFIFFAAIIYLTILYYLYDSGKDSQNSNEPIWNTNNLVKGILLPMRIFDQNIPIKIDFGGSGGISGRSGTSVSLAELNHGYTVSPMNLINCANEEKLTDRAKFVLSVEGNRLYVSTDFTYLFNDEPAGSIDNNHWKSLSKNIARFYSNDNLFEVIDNRGNVMFNMQFSPPDILSVNGYFVGTNCVYIIGDGKINAEPKVGNYIEKTLPQIKKIKPIYIYK